MSDYHFLITSSPTHKNLKIVAGGSAHGFKMMPVIGRYAVQVSCPLADPDEDVSLTLPR